MTRPASELVDLLRSRVGGHYVYGASVPLDDPDYRGNWDCAELISWGVYQTTGRLVGCVDNVAPVPRADPWSGAWARDALALPSLVLGRYVAGQGYRVPIGVAAATPGAVLVRTPVHSDGHVALSIGAGRTVEAYSTAKGVIESRSTGRRWDHGVLVPGLVYDVQSAILTAPPAVLRPGATGEAVRRVQAALGIAVDGDFGRVTAAAVATFQRAHGLVADGEVGPLTLAALGLS